MGCLSCANPSIYMDIIKNVFASFSGDRYIRGADVECSGWPDWPDACPGPSRAAELWGHGASWAAAICVAAWTLLCTRQGQQGAWVQYWCMYVVLTHWPVEKSIVKVLLFIRPFEKRTYYAMAMSVRRSVRPSEFSGLFYNVLWDINLKLGICIQ